MCGGGGNKIGGIGPGDKFFYMIGLCALIDHDSCRRPMAAMRPCSQRQSMQKSANILCDRSTLSKLEIFLISTFIRPFMSQPVDKLLSPMVASCDGHTTDAEHWWQHQWHTYVIYAPLMAHVLGLPCWQCSGML
jgi:hypothetical protein